MQFGSIWLIGPYQVLPFQARVHLGAMAMKGYSTFPKEVLCIPQSSSITGASPSGCLVSYSGHSLGEFYPSAEMQSLYSVAPANWTRLCQWEKKFVLASLFNGISIFMSYLMAMSSLEKNGNSPGLRKE